MTDETSHTCPRCCRNLQRILFVLVLLGLAAYGPKAVLESREADFERYYRAGCVAAQGGDIYDHPADRGDLEFKYFPFLAQLLSPLAVLCEAIAQGELFPARMPTPVGQTLGAALWYVILCGCYLGSLRLSVSMTRSTDPRATLWLYAGGLFLSARFFVANVRNGQVNMVAMFLAVLGCWLVLRQRRRLGGALVALGALVKFMPATFLLWFARRRMGWASAYFLVTVLAGLLFVPSLHWGGGPERNIAQLRGYIERRRGMVTDVPDEEAAGQSVPSLLNRLLRPANAAPLRARKIDGTYTDAPIHINVVELSRGLVGKIVFAAVVAFAALALWAMRGALADRPLRGALEVSLVFLLMLLISPEARKAHFVTLLVPGVTLAAVAWSEATLRRLALGGLVIAGMPLNLASRETVGERELYYLMNAYGVVLWPTLLLFAVVWVALRRRDGT